MISLYHATIITQLISLIFLIALLSLLCLGISKVFHYIKEQKQYKIAITNQLEQIIEQQKEHMEYHKDKH